MFDDFKSSVVTGEYIDDVFVSKIYWSVEFNGRRVNGEITYYQEPGSMIFDIIDITDVVSDEKEEISKYVYDQIGFYRGL